MAIPIFEQREVYSKTRFDELRNRLTGAFGSQHLPEEMVIFAAGSYARLEASEHSDIDLFFVYKGPRPEIEPRTKEFRLFGLLIRLLEDMSYPPLSNDCQYLSPTASDDILRNLGGPIDDSSNTFTLRMLMLLESRPLIDPEGHVAIQKDIIDSYYRDYPDHQASFEPWFLLNDISRFWKTLLLNYENKRNHSTGDDEEKTKHKVRNFKLKYSRMTTCFATIAAMGSAQTPLASEDLLSIVSMTPRQRLQHVAESLPAVSSEVANVLEAYAWFLEQTALSEQDLRALFRDKDKRAGLFTRARNYGTLMFDLLAAIDQQGPNEDGRLLRYLVI